jgi:hypothetical protein
MEEMMEVEWFGGPDDGKGDRDSARTSEIRILNPMTLDFMPQDGILRSTSPPGCCPSCPG